MKDADVILRELWTLVVRVSNLECTQYFAYTLAQLILQKKHRLSLLLVGLFSPATNGSLVLMPNGRLSLVTVGCEDRQGPTTTNIFLQYHLGL